MRGFWGPLLLVLVVAALTTAAAAEAGLVRALAASERTIAGGQLWRLATSGLIADRPLAASVICFALLAGLATLVCGQRVLWLAAAAGQIGSALVVYLVAAPWQLLHAHAAHGVWNASDYGVSTISAAWIGAIAATGWYAHGVTRLARATISLSCVAIGLVAYLLHPGVTILSSEHLLAFAAGVAGVKLAGEVGELHPLVRRAGLRAARADPVTVGAVAVTILILGGAGMPTALAALGRSVRDRDGHAACPAASVGRGCQAWRDTRADR